MTTSESSQQQNGQAPTLDGVEGEQLQNGAASGVVDGDISQLIIIEDDDGYRVEMRQQTEQTSHTAELVNQQPDGTEEV